MAEKKLKLKIFIAAMIVIESIILLGMLYPILRYDYSHPSWAGQFVVLKIDRFTGEYILEEVV